MNFGPNFIRWVKTRGGFPVGGMAESALFSWRNPEWPENLERNAESRVRGGSGIWTIFEAESGI